jgi:hypothetical protein
VLKALKEENDAVQELRRSEERGINAAYFSFTVQYIKSVKIPPENPYF